MNHAVGCAIAVIAANFSVVFALNRLDELFGGNLELKREAHESRLIGPDELFSYEIDDSGAIVIKDDEVESRTRPTCWIS